MELSCTAKSTKICSNKFNFLLNIMSDCVARSFDDGDDNDNDNNNNNNNNNNNSNKF